MFQKHQNIAELQACKQRDAPTHTCLSREVTRHLSRRNTGYQFLHIKNRKDLWSL